MYLCSMYRLLDIKILYHYLHDVYCIYLLLAFIMYWKAYLHVCCIYYRCIYSRPTSIFIYDTTRIHTMDGNFTQTDAKPSKFRCVRARSVSVRLRVV